MRHLHTLTLIMGLSAAPVLAQEQDGSSNWSQGLNMLQEGAQTLLEGLRRDLDPLLSDLASQVEDWSVYEAPEVLPNGDIIIRRREPLEDEPDQDPALPPDLNPDDEIEI